MLDKTGAEEITDILELDAADFKPILQKRLDSFQSALYRNYWSKLHEWQAEDFAVGAPLSKDGAHQTAAPPPPPLSDDNPFPDDEASVREVDVAPLPDGVHQMAEPPPPLVSEEVTRLPMSSLAPLCIKHEPSKRRKHSLKYWYLHAVSDGCQHCVKFLVKDMGVDKDARSDTQGWSAREFADCFQQREMTDYLQTL